MNDGELFEDQPTATAFINTSEMSYQKNGPKDIEYYVEQLKDILLVEGASDRNVTVDMKKVEHYVHWNTFVDTFRLIPTPSDDDAYDYDVLDGDGDRNDRTNGNINLRLKVLTTPLNRLVQVYKDQSSIEHREYTSNDDSILQMALRRSPPDYVLDMFSDVSQSYRFSKILFDQINTITIEDEEWLDVMAIIEGIVTEQDTDKKRLPNLMKEICEIRHSWREDTLLSIAARRDPPISIIKKLLDYAPKTISMRDTPRYDWMPFVYSLAYNAIPEVVLALIPNPEILRQTDVLINKDVYNLTPLHWSLFYGTPVAAVEGLVNADVSIDKQSLNITNEENKKPFEVAISNSVDMAIVKTLLPSHMKIEEIEKAMVRSIIGLQSNIKSNMVEYEVSPRTYGSLAEKIVEKPSLQRMLRFKSSERIATVMMVSECYVKVIFIIAFNNISHAYLHQHQGLEEIESEERPFFSTEKLLKDELISVILLFIALLYIVFREVHQMINIGLPYIASPWNWFDFSFIALSLSSTVAMVLQDKELLGKEEYHNGGINLESMRGIILVTSAFAWANLLFFIRSIYLPFAVFVSGLIGVFRTLIPFTVGVIIILCAFAQLYVTENVGTQECKTNNNDTENAEFCLFDSAFMKIYGMFVGGIEIGELSSTPSMLIISATFAFIVVILLLNIVIAIVSDKWSEVFADGKLHYWRNRLDFLAEVKSFDNTFRCFTRCNTSKSVRNSNGIISTILKTPYNVVVSICRLLWPRPDFWGNFDHIVDRVCSTKPLYGSFLWQFQYEWKIATRCQRILMSIKGICLVVFFFFASIIWFVGGVLTCGLFWPKSMRKVLFGHLISQDTTENDNNSGIEKVESNQKELLRRLKDLEAKIGKMSEKKITPQVGDGNTR